MNIPRGSRIARTAVVLLAAVLGWAAPAAPQSIDTDSLRRAYQEQARRYREEVSRGAAVFTNRSAPADRRIEAVRGVGAFEDEAHVAAALRSVFDTGEPAPVRVRAVQLAGHRAAADGMLLRRLLSLAADTTTDPALRRAAHDEAQAALVPLHAGHVADPEVLALLRRLARDRDPGLRRGALARLAVVRDPEALRMLEDGLRSPGQAPLPPVESVQLLGLVDPAPHHTVLRQVLAAPPDEAARVAAIHLLGGDPQSRGRLVGILRSAGETPEAREAAMGALLANDAENFERHVLPVVADEAAPSELRTRAIKSVELHRTTRDRRALRLRGDDFDARVEALAATSRDPNVREAARTYLARTRSPH